MGRSQETQWLAELHGGAKALGNPLFLADVTMPSQKPSEMRKAEAEEKARKAATAA